MAGTLKVPFALCSDGSTRHVSEVADKSIGPFLCLGCDKPLSLKQPKNKRAHFSHRPGANCSPESALHRYAKILLASQKTLSLPKLLLSDGPVDETVTSGGTFDFTEIILEKRESSFQPDAMAILGDSRLAVEFMVTHAVDELKEKKSRSTTFR